MMKSKTWLVLCMMLCAAATLAGCSAGSPSPTAEPAPLPRSMKGYELYSWQEGGQWRFTLITGTNRNKTVEEIVEAEDQVTDDGWVNLRAKGVEELIVLLGRLPEGEFVTWWGWQGMAGEDGQPTPFALPGDEIVEDVRAFCEQHGLELNVSQ